MIRAIIGVLDKGKNYKMFPHELFSVVEPFLNAAQEALPQVPVPENAISMDHPMLSPFSS